MPHLVYSGKCDFAVVHQAFSPQRRDAAGWICKLITSFISYDADTLLIECISVSQGYSQDYYARVKKKGETFTIGVDPHTNIVKDEGVKRTLLLIRDFIVSVEPEIIFIKSNLPPELLEEKHDV